MPYMVYLLKCSDNSLYCGMTNSLSKRIAMHNSGRASRYTRARLPAKLAYSEKAVSKGAALKREHQIKGLSRKEKLRLLEKWKKRKK